MELVPIYILQVGDSHAKYGYQIQPSIAHPDFLYNLAGVTANDIQNISLVTEADTLIAKRIFVPHHQTVVSSNTIITDQGAYVTGSIPTFSWNTYTTSGAVSLHDYMDRFYGYNYTLAQNNDPTQVSGTSFQATTNFNAQGFRLFLTRSIFQGVSSTVAATYDVQFTLFGNLIYLLRFNSNKNVQLIFSPDNGSSWQTRNESLKTGSSAVIHATTNSVPKDYTGMVAVEAEYFNQTLIIHVAGETAPYVEEVPLPANTDPIFTAVGLSALNFTHFSFSCHPMKFATIGTYASRQLELGFNPQTPVYWSFTDDHIGYTMQSGGSVQLPFPNINSLTSTVSITTLSQVGQAVQYQLQIQNTQTGLYQNTDYADFTGVATRVIAKVDGLWQPPSNTYDSIVAKEIQEDVIFDIQSLTIHHALSVLIDNFYGINITESLTGIRGSGNIAVSLALGYEHYSPPLYQRFVGLCGRYEYIRPDNVHSWIRMICTDQMVQLSDSFISAPPDMDGWNHWYAMRFLANYCGIPDEQLGWIQWVPSDPYSYVNSDPYLYFLPFGIGMHPWTPRNRALSVLELMGYIRQATGFLLYFDVFGELQYIKWIPPTVGQVKKIFTEVPTGYEIENGGENVSEFWSSQGVSDISPVRNQVVLIGIDAYGKAWNPIVSKIEDSQSIDSPPGNQPSNYVGYKKPMILVDSRFASIPFAESVAYNLAQFVSLPEISMTITTWMQPDIYPMDVIQIDELKSDAAGVPFYVLSTSTKFSILSGKQIFTTQITGRLLTS